MNNKHLFTSESVTEGHPDKVCDPRFPMQFSTISWRKTGRACSLRSDGDDRYGDVMGEISTECYVDIDAIAA